MIAQLNNLLGVPCDMPHVLQLDASTDEKFSRHLVFQLENSAFHDNKHAGKSVKELKAN